MRIVLCLDEMFEDEDEVNLVLSHRVLQGVLDALQAHNEDYLRANEGTPRIFSSGIRYRPERSEDEEFWNIPRILKAGGDDCDGIAPWRAAEIVVREGDSARCYPHWTLKPGGGQSYHILVERRSRRTGRLTVEDPCQRLGMSQLHRFAG